MSINRLASNFALSANKYLLILCRAWSLQDTFLQSSYICFLNSTSYSVVIPSYFTSLDEGMTLPASFKLKQSFLFAPRTMNRNFPGLALRELISNQSITLLRSLLRFRKQDLNFCHDRNECYHLQSYILLTFVRKKINRW